MIGFLAAAATLATFCQTDIRRLRSWAVMANCLFILYAWIGVYAPVLVLHVILLPINLRMLFLSGRTIKQ
ncbi:hypothetical protein AXW83_23845 [Bosea sp. PAMC 26642]|nr:hypothetical protein AXW83_23845 [Bosea sp. PAMC 26642]